MNVDVFKRAGAVALIVLLCAGPALAQGQVDINKANEGTGDIFGFMLKVIVKWVFPLIALVCAIYGLGRGMKRGEWDFFTMCIVASVVIALFPAVLEKILGMNFSAVMK